MTDPVLLTDGASRNGVPAVSSRSGRLAVDFNRRNGKDRDLYVLDPRDPSSSRMFSEVSGSWEVKAWSPDDRTVLAFEMLPGNDTAIWRIEVETGQRFRLTPPEPATWMDPHFAPDGATVYGEDRRGEYGDERDPKVREFLSRMSPLAHAAAIKVPLMIAYDVRTRVCRSGQAESMFRAVFGNDVPVWLALYDDEGHENFPRSRDHGHFNFYSWILFVETSCCRRHEAEPTEPASR